MTVRANSTHAFETLKYVFDISVHQDDNDLEDEERESAFVDWTFSNIEDWEIIETNEVKEEITLKK